MPARYNALYTSTMNQTQRQKCTDHVQVTSTRSTARKISEEWEALMKAGLELFRSPWILVQFWDRHGESQSHPFIRKATVRSYPVSNIGRFEKKSRNWLRELQRAQAQTKMCGRNAQQGGFGSYSWLPAVRMQCRLDVKTKTPTSFWFLHLIRYPTVYLLHEGYWKRPKQQKGLQ